jgi:hypothetical protein
VAASPFLAFAVAVHRTAAGLASAHHIPERACAGPPVPVFDAAQLADFLRAPLRRLFLAELLTSFARVASGSYWVRTDRGWHPKRFSELDPVRLAGLADAVSQAERPGIYRRLGDVALFLASVAPDYPHGTRDHENSSGSGHGRFFVIMGRLACATGSAWRR